MTSVIIVAILSFIVATLFVYIESRLFDNPHDITDYIKIGLLVALISSTIVYLMGSPSLPRLQLGGGYQSNPANNMSVVDELQEEMLSGYPNF